MPVMRSIILCCEKPLIRMCYLYWGVPMSHHIFNHHRHRFGRRLFAGLLVLLVILAFTFLLRRHNMRNAGMQPKPVMEDLGDIYRDLQSRFDSRNFGGIVNEIFGRGPIPA